VDVVACREHDDAEVVSRELALVKIRVEAPRRAEVLQIAEYFRAKTVDMAEQAMVLEITGTPDKIDAMIALLRKFGIEELIRTGKVIVARGDRET
jgi:acetolactate synthase small subunit